MINKECNSVAIGTVAEGVEEKEQVEFLKQQGCDMIQGYYFAKPMPKEEYEGCSAKIRRILCASGADKHNASKGCICYWSSGAMNSNNLFTVPKNKM